MNRFNYNNKTLLEAELEKPNLSFVPKPPMQYAKKFMLGVGSKTPLINSWAKKQIPMIDTDNYIQAKRIIRNTLPIVNSNVEKVKEMLLNHDKVIKSPLNAINSTDQGGIDVQRLDALDTLAQKRQEQKMHADMYKMFNPPDPNDAHSYYDTFTADRDFLHSLVNRNASDQDLTDDIQTGPDQVRSNLIDMAAYHHPQLIDAVKNRGEYGGSYDNADFVKALKKHMDETYNFYKKDDTGLRPNYRAPAINQITKLQTEIEALSPILETKSDFLEPGQPHLKAALGETEDGDAIIENAAREGRPITPDEVRTYVITAENQVKSLNDQIDNYTKLINGNQDTIKNMSSMPPVPKIPKNRWQTTKNIGKVIAGAGLGYGLVQGMGQLSAGTPSSSSVVAPVPSDPSQEINQPPAATAPAPGDTDKIHAIYNFARNHKNDLLIGTGAASIGLSGLALASHLADKIYGDNNNLAQQCRMIQDPTQRAECEKTIINKISSELQSALSNCDDDDCKDHLHSTIAKNQAQLMDPSAVTESSILNRINSRNRLNESIAGELIGGLSIGTGVLYGLTAAKNLLIDPVVDSVKNTYDKSVWETEGCGGIEDPTEQTRCRLHILSNAAKELNTQLNMCRKTSNPQACEDNINKKLASIAEQKENIMTKFRTVASE